MIRVSPVMNQMKCDTCLVYITSFPCLTLTLFLFKRSGLYFKQSWEWLRHNIFLLISFLLIVIFTIVVLLLLISHLYLISCNTTTWEFMSYHRISYLRHSELENPFDQGVIRNLWMFFCSCHLTAWEKIYFHRNNEPV